MYKRRMRNINHKSDGSQAKFGRIAEAYSSRLQNKDKSETFTPAQISRDPSFLLLCVSLPQLRVCW